MRLFDFLFQRLKMLLMLFQFLFRLVQIPLSIQLSEQPVMTVVTFSFRQLLQKTNLDDSMTKINYQKKFQGSVLSLAEKEMYLYMHMVFVIFVFLTIFKK